MDDGLDEILREVFREVRNAQAHFNPFNSAHEGYAVLLEEVEELWDAIRNDKKLVGMQKHAMRKEAIQVAAMAVRFVLDITDQ